MQLSKFFKKVKIDENMYAIYNSLIMEIIYVNEEKLNKIIKNDVSLGEIKKLKELGIYVDNKTKDQLALNEVRKRYNEVTGKINIMYLIMSSACNLGCKYCFIENCKFNNNVEINMREDTALIAVEKYTNYLIKNNLKGSVIFYGGEPLVNYDVIKKVLLRAKELNSPIKFSMVTNATLLDEEKIAFLAKNNVEIGISIDGPKELNDKNRVYRLSNNSVYDEIIKKFPMLDMKKVKYGLSITISEDFLDNQDDVLIWLKNLGINSIFYNLYHYTSYDKNWKNYYERASKFLIKSYNYLTKENIYDGRLIRKIDSFYNSEFKFSDCGAIGANQLAIKPNGDICICHGYLKTDKYVISNIKYDSFENVLKSEEIKFWKNRCTLNNDKCIDCEALYICGGGCAIQAEALFNDRASIDEPFCIHTKESLKWIFKDAYDTQNNIGKVKKKEVIR